MKNVKKMKRLSYQLALVMLLMLTACGAPTFITPEKSVATFEMEGDTVIVKVISDGKWEVQSKPEWLTVNVAAVSDSESQIVICAGKNDNGAERDGEIILAGGDIRSSITVKQVSKCTKLEVTNDNVSFDKDGGSETVSIDTDGSVNVKADAPFTASLTDGVLTITAPANEGKARSGKITLSANDLTAEVAVSQKGNVCTRCGGKGKVKCTRCNGSGLTPTYGEDAGWWWYGCSSCGGHGAVYIDPFEGREDGDSDYRKGSGKVTCPVCHGSGS